MDHLAAPSGWRLTQLREACELRKEAINPAEHSIMSYVGLEHIDPGNPELKRNGNSSEVNSSKSRFYPGDILYGKLRPYLDKSVLVDFEGLCSTDILVLKSKESTVPQFLVNLIHTNRFLNYAISTSTGVNHPRTSWSSISAFQFLLPPLPEQRAIARALRSVQGAREARLREVALERERKAALMEHLFAYGTRGEATKQTEIGEMPESWKIERIDAYCAKSSLKNPKDDPDKSFSYVDVSSVSNESYRIIETKKIIGRDAPSRARKYIKKDDVIFATVRPTLKRIALVPCDLDGQICSTGFCVLRANRDNLNPLYLYYYLLTEQIAKKVDILQKGATYPAISDSELLNQLAPVPSINEQAQIAGILCACDSKIAALDHEARLLQELFRAMLEELMSARLPAGALVEPEG